MYRASTLGLKRSCRDQVVFQVRSDHQGIPHGLSSLALFSSAMTLHNVGKNCNSTQSPGKLSTVLPTSWVSAPVGSCLVGMFLLHNALYGAIADFSHNQVHEKPSALSDTLARSVSPYSSMSMISCYNIFLENIHGDRKWLIVHQAFRA